MSELECQDCGKVGHEVEVKLCPFALEIHDEEVFMQLCPGCYEQRWLDI